MWLEGGEGSGDEDKRTGLSDMLRYGEREGEVPRSWYFRID